MQRWFRFPVLAALLAGLCLGAAAQAPVSGKVVAKSASPPAPEQRVDINSATLEQLLRIPAMKRTWAARIVRYRPYRTKLDLEEHGIVSEEVYERIKDYVIAHRDEE